MNKRNLIIAEVLSLFFIVGILIYAGYFKPVSDTPSPVPTPNPSPVPAPQGFTSPKVILDNIGPNSLVYSGMRITGKARLYYFEASFPVKLLDANGKVILQTYAQAEGEWMTEEFVPFTVQNFQFAKPSTSSGTLILAKDNPSGLPEHDEQVEISVRFE